MTMECSPRLADMVRRCALPISVDFREYNHQQRRNGARDHFEISWPGKARTLFMFRNTAEAATRVYFDLVDSLANPGDPSLAGSSDGCSATPEGGM